MTRLLEIMAAIRREREWQDQKYGPVLHAIPNLTVATAGDTTALMVQGRGGHPLGEWLIIVESELNEAKKALVHGGMQSVKGRDSIRAEIIQIAAVCVAALEQHGLGEAE